VARRLQIMGRTRSCASERPAVASVADPSAIAPPLPLPTRSDAAPPAGPSSAFANLLDGTAPPTAPQPQSAGTSTSGAPASSGKNTSDPAASRATAGPPTGKDDDAGNDSTDPSPAVDAILVAGLSLSPVALAAQDPQGASTDDTPATGGDASDKPGDREDANAPSDSVPTGLIAALPNLIPVTGAAGVATSSPSEAVTPVGSAPIAAVQSEAILSGPSTSPPGADASGSASNPNAPASALNLLPAVSPITSALAQVDALQTAIPPPALQATADPGASDQTGRSPTAAATTLTPAVPSASLTPIAVLASVNPSPPTPLSRDLQLPDQPVGNAGSPHEAGEIVIPLAAQVAARFAAPVHANDGNASDSGTGVLFGFAGGDAGGTTAATSSGPAGAVVPASFNPGIAMVQPASAPPVAPQHATLTSEMVPLAGVPIAIVARAEGGEKKFEIRLDPPDLGRIEVQLNVDGSGRATSHLIVDRADTLDLLRRDAPALERALQSAGLTTDEGALQFSLRDQSFTGRDQWAPATIAAPAAVADNDLAPVDTAVRRYGTAIGLGGGIDIRV
jgi:flagellar hook-length control protein FliK